MAFVGESVGEDLIRSAQLDMFPMPLTCSTFGITENPALLTVLRHKKEELGITAEILDEIAKTPSPAKVFRELLGVE